VDKLILHLEGIDVQYIIALDKRTGKTIWKKERPSELYENLAEAGRKAFVTPIVMIVNNKELLISNAAPACIAYDPESGQEIWRVVRGEHSTISMPFTDQKMLYYYTSQITPAEGRKYSELLAVNPAGTGDITENNIVWRMQAPLLQLLTPVVKNGFIYTIDSNSMLYCLDAMTGEVIWSDRMKGKFNSSPVAASGNIYFSSTQGITYVLKEGKNMQIREENTLDGEIWATPAFVGGSILMRTSNFLYKISSLKE
jgi:outer membrane protein assembly factor BamB